MKRSSVTNALLRTVLTAAHHVLALNWWVRRPRTFGAHALALTGDRRIVLVLLRYAPGWRLPGGGMKAGEDPRDAVLRELREEIGLTAHGRIRLACELEELTSFKRDLASLLVVDDVAYSPPRWSWEIERVIDVPLDDLPADLSPRARTWIEAIDAHI